MPKIYKVESGLLRSYSIDKKGKEHIFLCAPEGWIIADASDDSGSCQLHIDALEDAVVIVRERENHIPNIDVEKIINRFSVLQKRIIMLMSAPALDRYQHFEETYPDIIQRVPQKMVASYSGITPEALSNLTAVRTKSKPSKVIS